MSEDSEVQNKNVIEVIHISSSETKDCWEEMWEETAQITACTTHQKNKTTIMTHNSLTVLRAAQTSESTLSNSVYKIFLFGGDICISVILVLFIKILLGPHTQFSMINMHNVTFFPEKV